MTTATPTIPPKSEVAEARLNLGEVTIESLAEGSSDDGNRRVRFRMIANSGVPITLYGKFKMVVDLESMTVRSQKKPVLLQHDHDRRVGWTESIVLTERGLEIEGVVAQSTTDGRQVSAELVEGYPFEASISVSGFSLEHVPEEKKLTVNGVELEGPAIVLRNGQFREVSFVALGADPLTDTEMLQLKGCAMPKPDEAATGVVEPDTAKHSADTTQSSSGSSTREPVDAVELLELAGSRQLELAKALLKRKATREEALAELHADLLTRIESLEQGAGASEADLERQREQVRREERLAAVRDSSKSLGDGGEAPAASLAQFKAEWEAMSLAEQGEHWSFEEYVETRKAAR